MHRNSLVADVELGIRGWSAALCNPTVGALVTSRRWPTLFSKGGTGMVLGMDAALDQFRSEMVRCAVECPGIRLASADTQVCDKGLTAGFMLSDGSCYSVTFQPPRAWNLHNLEVRRQITSHFAAIALTALEVAASPVH